MSNREDHRYQTAVDLIKSEDYSSVLDLGCRDKVLKKFLKPNIKYQGIDYKESDEVLAHNLENGIPFEDNSFDIVCALDVLEHLENIHFLFEEILRVCKKEAIVALPNMYYWKFRLRFLKGKDLSEKYPFTTTKILDRHRWITSYYSSNDFIEANSENYLVDRKDVFYQYRSDFLKSIDSNFSKSKPNLFVYTMFYSIKK